MRRAYHVEMRFDIAIALVEAVEANVRRGLGRVAPDITMQFKQGRKRTVKEVERRYVTLIFTIEAESPRRAQDRAVYWLRRGVPTLRTYPDNIKVKDLA